MSNKENATNMTQSTKRELKPRLRFPEFQDAGEWEEKRLRKIAKSVSDKALEKNNDNILTLSGEHGLVLQSDYFGKKIAGDNVSRYIRIALNDFVYNDRTTKSSTYGSIKRLSKYKSGIVSPIYKCFRFGFGENPVFWDWYFESGFHEPQLHGLVNEGARAGRFNISIEKFLSTLVWHPGGAEQKKIADCLSSIDDLITAQTQKLDTLKTHKKGLMQQLFPAEGGTLPKLRFPEFQDAGEWEEKRMEDVAPLQRGFDLPSDQIIQGSIPVVYSNGIQNFHNKRMAIAPGLVTGRSGTIGKIHFIEEGDYWPHNTSLWVTSFKGNFPKFIYYLYNAIGMNRFSSGSGVPTLNRNYVHAFQASLPPSVGEQQKIANCFSSLDDLITAQTQKLDTLKTHKKGMMQQLFPAMEEVSS